MKRRHTLALAAAAVCVMITGCGDDGKKEQAAAALAAQEKSALKVAWLYPSPKIGRASCRERVSGIV